jgi:Tfp pilus assembly protein PilF
LKDNPYCSDCLLDVDEDVEFDRSLELDNHEHEKKLKEFEKALKARKADAELVQKIRKQRFKEAKEAYKLKLDTAKIINSTRNESKKSADNSEFRNSARIMRKHGFNRGNQR